MRESMPTGIVIQASMKHPEFPGMPMQMMGGRPLLDYVLERLDGLLSEVQLVVLTSTDRHDDMIAGFCEQRRLACLRQSAPGLLPTLLSCAERYNFSNLVLTSADQPFLDTLELDRLISFHVEQSNDYSTSRHDLPQGAGAEIITHAALVTLCSATESSRAANLEDGLHSLPNKLREASLPISLEKVRPDVRVTVISPRDLRMAQFIASRASTPWPDTEEVVGLYERYQQDPEMAWTHAGPMEQDDER